MQAEAAESVLSWNAEGRPVIAVGGAEVAALAALVEADPSLKQPDKLGAWADAVNHLQYGSEYHVIHDPEAYRARYAQRLASENPDEPWREGVVRVSDFGVCDTAEIQPPRREGASLLFYAEDDYLGIPYHVTAPLPEQPSGEVHYEPLPMTPAE